MTIDQSIERSSRRGRLYAVTIAVLLVVALLTGLLISTRAGKSGDYAENLQRVRQMSPEELVELKRKKDRFDDLAPKEKARRKRLHQAIMEHPDSDELVRVAKQYQEWLKTLTTPERTELLAMDMETRIEKVKWYRAKFEEKIFGLAGSSTALPNEDISALSRWVETFVQEHEEVIRERDERLYNYVKRRYSDNLEPWFLYFWYTHRRDPEELLEESEMNDLLAQLSEEANQIVAGRESSEEKLRLVSIWIRNAVQAKIRPPVTDEKLRRFLQSLPPEKRREFDDMSPLEWREEVEEAYYRRYGTDDTE